MTTTAHHDEATVELTRPAGPPPQTPAGYPAAPWGATPAYRPGPQWTTGFPPPPPYGPQTPFGAPAPRRRGPAGISRNTWIGVAAALALVVVMIVAIVAATTAVGGDATARRYADTATTTAQAAPVVTPAELSGMLLRPEMIAQLVGQPGSETMARGKPVRSRPYPSVGISDPACAPVSLPAQEIAYQGSGYTALQEQTTIAQAAGTRQKLWVFQESVATYPTATAAETFVTASAARWTACPGSWREEYADGVTGFWSAAQMGTTDGLLSTLISQENGGGWGCWRGLKAHGNAVMDFAVCAENLPASVPAATAAVIANKGRPI